MATVPSYRDRGDQPIQTIAAAGAVGKPRNESGPAEAEPFLISKKCRGSAEARPRLLVHSPAALYRLGAGSGKRGFAQAPRGL